MKAYYEEDVDFDGLAQRDAEFAAIAQKGRRDGFLNFQDPKIVQQLTKSILRADFNLHLTLPDDRLCPPVPVRWNYVRWIQELIDTTSPKYTENHDDEREVVGMDVGVGASCIYALLACETRESWKMLGTDVDGWSLQWAQKNVEKNSLGDRIRLRRVNEGGGLLDAVKDLQGTLDFMMTNPPFYSSRADFQAAYTSDPKRDGTKNPSAVTAGAQNEMICPGGDVGFITRILNESLHLREKVQWYTAMLSKLSSLQQIIALLKQHEVTNYAVTSLHPGKKTKRWAVAWSFGDLRPRNDVARHGELVLSVLPLPTEQTIYCPLQDEKWSGRKIDETLQGLDVRWTRDVGVVECRENVWSRAARRKRQFGGGAEGGKMGEEDSAEEKVAMAIKITCKHEEVVVRWLRGHEHALFVSFCGMLKRALTEQ